VPNRAEEKLGTLLAELKRHREAVSLFLGADLASLAKRHERLIVLVAGEIRDHCRQYGLPFPDELRDAPRGGKRVE
jgi:hypothetical protein